jgi:hypothetical protein
MCGGWGGLLAAVPFLAAFVFALWWGNYRSFHSRLDARALGVFVFCVAAALVLFAWPGLCG